MKTASIGKKDGLKPLLHEDLVHTFDDDAECEVEQSTTFDSMKQARELAAGMLDTKHVQCFEDYRRMLIGAEACLLSVDPSFRLEIEIVNNFEPIMDAHIEASIFKLLPSQTKFVTLEEAELGLSALRDDRTFRLSSMTTQAKVTTLRDIITNMIGSISPVLSIGANGGFYGKVLGSLAFFCNSSEDSADGTATQFRGNSAVQNISGKMADEFENLPGEMTRGKIEQLQRYRWLLSDEQQKAMASWVSTVLKNKVPAAVAKSSSSSIGLPIVGCRVSGVVSCKKAKTDTNMANIMAFFPKGINVEQDRISFL